MPAFPRSLLLAFAIALALLVAAAVVFEGDGEDGTREPVEEQEFGASPADPVPYDGRSPREPAGTRQRILVALPRPALGERPDLAEMDAAARRAYVASLRDESRALRSGLEARGIRLGDVVTYERTWNGFAATVRPRDLARLTAQGMRTRGVRRFFPAASEPVRVPGAPDDELAVPDGDAPVVALLSSGLPPLPFLAGGGHDAVGRDRDPAAEADPRDRERTESGALGPAAVLAAAGMRVRPYRVSGLRTAPDGTVSEHGTTDEVLAGLERAVDPDGDGDPSDRADVVVVGVNAPYAGFAGAPEAEAVAAAVRLGAEVVAPAGHEGPAAGAYGTIGSPGGAAAAVTVGAASEPSAVPRVRLQIEGLRVEGAAVLAGAPSSERLTTGGPLDAERPEDVPEEVAGKLGGRLVVVRAGDNPGARVATAAAAGAAAIVVADEREDALLPALPAGRVAVPVLGVAGDAARAVLEAGADRSATMGPVALGPRLQPGVATGATRSRFSSRGPAFDGHPAPDVWAPATVLTGGRVTAGGAVAAAAVAARLAKGETLPVPDGEAPAPVAAPVGELTLTREEETGVRFSVGAFERGLPTRIVPVERLELTLERIDAERTVTARRLTPPGGERALLPGEYAYTLPAAALRALRSGEHRFLVRAWAPRQERPTVRASETFRTG